MARYSKDQAAAVGAAINSALKGVRRPRRTRQQAAAERLVDAIAVLLESGVDESDLVAFEDARAAVDKYRAEE